MLKILIAGSLAVLTVSNTGWTQTYPTRPIRIVVGVGSGGPDTTARLLAQQLAVQVKQPVIVDNRPGAIGSVGAGIVANAVPDGHTLLVSAPSVATLSSIYKNLPFDVARDLAPVSLLAAGEGSILLVNASLPVQNVKELIALARKPGSKLSYGSNGVGTVGHLVAALFNSRAKIDMLHVPYRGAGLTTTALMVGEIQMMFGTPTLGLPLVKAGKIRALAYDNDTRAPFLPDVPTLPEAGVPTSNFNSWHGLFAPSKTPPVILMKLEGEVRRAVALPEMRDRIEKLGLIPVGSSSAEFRKTMAGTLKAAAEAVRAAGIQPE